jgi:class 3 adenylate cyclase
MGEILTKNLDQPDEVVDLPKLSGQLVALGDLYVGRYVHQPGWRWATDVKPQVGTPSCQVHHQGVVLSGRVHMLTDEGGHRTLGPGDVFDIGPGHDAYVVGDEPFVTLEFRGARDWARPAAAGQRVLATMLFTDLVGSTALAAQLGDTAWKRLLARHYDRVRLELDRFRGEELRNTGDGFLALFDGPARAVQCAASIARATRQDGLEVRAGVHAGEVERYSDNVQGVAVHLAARIMALAGAGEVWLSAATVALLEGAGLDFVETGEFELKGLSGRRRLYRLAKDEGHDPMGMSYEG